MRAEVEHRTARSRGKPGGTVWVDDHYGASPCAAVGEVNDPWLK